MTIEACSPLQVEKDQPCWPPLERKAGEPMRMTRGVGFHRFVLDTDSRSVDEYRHLEERSYHDSKDWLWVNNLWEILAEEKQILR